MTNEVIKEREARVSFYESNINFDSLNRDNLSQVLARVTQEEVSPAMAQLDSLLADSSTKVSLSGILADAILGAKELGAEIDSNAVDLAVVMANKAIKEAGVKLDGLGSVNGSEVLATYIKLNIYTVLGANVPFVGDIADLVPVAGARNNTKFKIYSVEPTVSKAMGDMTSNETINGLNSGDTFAILERHETQISDKDTDTYTFDLKAKKGDDDNAPMERGTNQIIVGGKIFLDDYEVSASENPAKRVVKVGDITYTGTFDYGAGKIKLEVSDSIGDGVKIYFEGSITTEEISKGTGSIKSDIRDYNYVAVPVSVDVVVNMMALRQALQSAGLNLQSNDLSLALMKISEEIKHLKIEKTLAVAQDYAESVDLTTQTESTVAERYKHFLITVEGARADITEKSGLTSNVALVGGRALVKVYSGLSTDSTKTNVISSNETSIRYLGLLNDSIPCFYNPKNDEEYPTDDDGFDSVFVVGNPADPTKKVVVSGVGLPIIPDDSMGSDTNSNKTTRLMGKMVVSTNKDPKSRELVRRIKVKTQS